MTRAEQKAFLTKFVNKVRDELLDHADKWPTTWDEHELQELVADAFDVQRTPVMVIAQQNGHLRYRDYITRLNTLKLIP